MRMREVGEEVHPAFVVEEVVVEALAIEVVT